MLTRSRKRQAETSGQDPSDVSTEGSQDRQPIPKRRRKNAPVLATIAQSEHSPPVARSGQASPVVPQEISGTGPSSQTARPDHTTDLQQDPPSAPEGPPSAPERSSEEELFAIGIDTIVSLMAKNDELAANGLNIDDCGDGRPKFVYALDGGEEVPALSMTKGLLEDLRALVRDHHTVYRVREEILDTIELITEDKDHLKDRIGVLRQRSQDKRNAGPAHGTQEEYDNVVDEMQWCERSLEEVREREDNERRELAGISDRFYMFTVARLITTLNEVLVGANVISRTEEAAPHRQQEGRPEARPEAAADV